MSKKLFPLLVLLFSTYYSFASAEYVLSLQNFETQFEIIKTNHNLTNLGEGYVEDWLKQKLDPIGSTFYAPAPHMCITGTPQSNVLFRWDGRFQNYYHSYLDLNSGNSDENQTPELGIVISPPGVQYHIFALYGVSGLVRSNLFIIIIDRDIFFCGGGPSTPGAMTINPEAADMLQSTELRCMPNPTQQMSTVTFDLTEAQIVSMELIDPITGKIIARKLEEQFLDSGQHQYEFDLQDLPSNRYLVVLRLKDRVQNITILKIE